jgi:hypothetical protein
VNFRRKDSIGHEDNAGFLGLHDTVKLKQGEATVHLKLLELLAVI